jgi:class 3 adenylate cyclase
MGDNILAWFGYPQAHEDDAERAVHARVNVLAKLGQLRPPCNAQIQARVGIATSLVFVGKNQDVAGEPATIAARLQMLAPPSSVTIAASKLISRVFVCADASS